MRNSRKILEKRIAQLETQQRRELIALKEQLEVTYESLKPIHLISNFIENSLGNKKVKQSLLKTGVSSSLSFLISKILFKKSKNLLSYITSTAIQSVLSKVIVKIISKK